jgi:hypothetical protein
VLISVLGICLPIAIGIFAIKFSIPLGIIAPRLNACSGQEKFYGSFHNAN